MTLEQLCIGFYWAASGYYTAHAQCDEIQSCSDSQIKIYTLHLHIHFLASNDSEERMIRIMRVKTALSHCLCWHGDQAFSQ